MSQPVDEDGFHSIAWDDAPPSSSTRPDVLSPLVDEDEESEGFENISPTSIPEDSPNMPEGSSRRDPLSGAVGGNAGHGTGVNKGKGVDLSQASVEGAREEAQVHLEDWGGRWMVVEVRDPVKEHEGSKDMYVSYAVKTTVSTCQLLRARA